MPHARLVHLATHGEVSVDSPMSSRIILSHEKGQRDFLEARDLIACRCRRK